jgi:ferritin
MERGGNMISKKLSDSINDQINAELYSAYLYLSVRAYFESKGFCGFGSWMGVQFQEETSHAMKFFDYLVERGGKVELKEIKEPTKSWDSPLAAFEAAYAHEKYITGRINAMVDLAMEEKDHATVSFLRWYVDEQVEEESSVSAIVDKLKYGQGSPGVELMLDKELSGRIFSPAVKEN